MRAWGMTHRGAVREQNQDSFRIVKLDSALLCVVCDGMGGALAGDVASNLAVEVFCENVTAAARSRDTAAVLRTAVLAANNAVFEKAYSDPAYYGMGTTLVAAFVTQRQTLVVNVGDSRAYKIDRNGINRITNDHSLVEDLVRRGELTPDQARFHPKKNLITRALGAEPLVDCDIFRPSLRQGDHLLLCSDGLINTLCSQEILYETIHGGPEDDCCQRMIDIALQRGAPDNVTAVLIRI